jgi:hypothetical protein
VELELTHKTLEVMEWLAGFMKVRLPNWLRVWLQLTFLQFPTVIASQCKEIDNRYR